PVAASGSQVLVCAPRGEIHVLDAASGRPRGCIPQPRFDDARVDGGLLFTHRRPHWGEEGRVAAVDLASGRRQWMHVGATACKHGNRSEAFAVGNGTVVAGENGTLRGLGAPTGARVRS